MATQSRIYTGNKVLSQPLPELLTREGYRTTSSALHPDKWYIGPIQEWQIELEAMKLFGGKDLEDLKFIVESAEGDVSPGKNRPIPINVEQFVCGEEASICGRFIQNALSPVIAVASANGIKTRFSDFKSCAEGSNSPEGNKNRRHNIPDFVAIRCTANRFLALQLDGKPFMILLGEGKTEWVHDLSTWWKGYKIGQENELRNALGQLGRYMHVYKIKYAFLTTYDQTIFVCQDYVQDKNGEFKPGLKASRPISRSDTPSDAPVRLSVRQCLYYFLHLTKGDSFSYKFENPLPLDKWVEEKNVPQNQDKEPHTPARDKLETPQQAISALSPDIVRTTNPDDRLRLYRAENGKFATILSFHEDQIQPEGVMIDGKWIRVDIEDDDHGHRTSTITNNNNYNNGRADHGLASIFGGLSLNQSGPRPEPTLPRAGGGAGLFGQRKPLNPSPLSTSMISQGDSFLGPQTPTPAARFGCGLQPQGLASGLTPASPPPQQGQTQSQPPSSGHSQRSQHQQQGPASQPRASTATRGRPTRQTYAQIHRSENGMTAAQWEDYRNSTSKGKK